jgi:hypothetical protein
MLSTKGANLQGWFDAFGASADTQCPQDGPDPFRVADGVEQQPRPCTLCEIFGAWRQVWDGA